MNKERLDWVISGLNQHALTKVEDHCIKTVQEDFDKNHELTEQQEEKIKTLYKEKSILTPNKKSSNYYSFKESTPKKVRPRKLFAKDVSVAS